MDGRRSQPGDRLCPDGTEPLPSAQVSAVPDRPHASRRAAPLGVAGRMRIFFLAATALACPTVVEAHPIARCVHDRTLTVRVTPGKLLLDYRLDVDEFTVVYLDLPGLVEMTELAHLSSPAEFYQAFRRAQAPLLQTGVRVRWDGRRI